MTKRIVMSLPLHRQALEAGTPIRSVKTEDRDELAILLYAAYRGTIDDEGGTYADASQEIDRLFAGAYGEFLPTCSFVIEEGESIASASLLTWWEVHQAPLIAFTMTRPEYRRRGYARLLIQTSMNALLDHGYDRLTLVVTVGNAPAQRLYQTLGFRTMTGL